MKLKIYTLTTGLFLVGVLCGVLLTIGFAKRQIKAVTASPTAEVSERLVRFLDRQLKLSDEQEIKVAEIIQQSTDEILPLRKELRERILTIMQTYHPQVAEQLDDAQKAKLEQLKAKLLETWQLEGNPDSITPK